MLHLFGRLVLPKFERPKFFFSLIRSVELRIHFSKNKDQNKQTNKETKTKKGINRKELP